MDTRPLPDNLQPLADLDAEIALLDRALVEQVESLNQEVGTWIAKIRELVGRANEMEARLVGQPTSHPRGAVSATVGSLTELLPAVAAHRRRQKIEQEEADRLEACRAERAEVARTRRAQYLRNLERAITADSTPLGRVDLEAVSQLYTRRR